MGLVTRPACAPIPGNRQNGPPRSNSQFGHFSSLVSACLHSPIDPNSQPMLGSDNQTSSRSDAPLSLCLLLALVFVEEGLFEFSVLMGFTEKILVYSPLKSIEPFCEFMVKVLNSFEFSRIKQNLNSVSKLVNLALQRFHRDTHARLRGRYPTHSSASTKPKFDDFTKQFGWTPLPIGPKPKGTHVPAQTDAIVDQTRKFQNPDKFHIRVRLFQPLFTSQPRRASLTRKR